MTSDTWDSSRLNHFLFRSVIRSELSVLFSSVQFCSQSLSAFVSLGSQSWSAIVLVLFFSGISYSVLFCLLRKLFWTSFYFIQHFCSSCAHRVIAPLSLSVISFSVIFVLLIKIIVFSDNCLLGRSLLGSRWNFKKGYNKKLPLII